MLDLDAKRAERAAERAEARRHAEAAGREARGETFPIRIGGEIIATLQPELPLTALSPIREIDDEIGLLLHQAMLIAQKERAARGSGASADTAMDATKLLIDLLVTSPNLPQKMIDIARTVGANLLGEEGLTAFLAAAPSVPDVAALAGGLFDWYGTSLGEAWRSSESSTDAGGTSNTTSTSSTTASTPDGSTSEPATPPSSESAAQAS